jgi:tRNA-dihydrouridine synthase B
MDKIKITNAVPTYIQLIGYEEKELVIFLNKFVPEPGFLGFNLNLGCPAPEMIRKGYGCALIKRITKVKKLVEIIRGFGYGVSIKLRLGLNSFEKKKKVYLNLINEVDADFFVVHARHGKETFVNPADFSVYFECVATGKKIIANGDIKTKKQIDNLKSIGVKGAMIGLTASKNPEIFKELK